MNYKKILILSFIFHTFLTTAFAKETVDNPKKIPLEELRIFVEVFEQIKNNYVEEVDDKTLLQNTIKGMLSSLDPHSAFLIGNEYEDLQEGTNGEFGGLGIEVNYEKGFLEIISPIDDTPAYKAGIKAGDKIIKIDSKSLRGMSLSESIGLLRGAVGTKIKLTIYREGEKKPLIFNIKRAIISISSVKSRLLDDDFGYIRLRQFQIHTTRDMLKAINKLIKQNKKPLKGLVLDLRNNPGGVLTAAVGVVDAFVKDGLIVYTKGRIKSADVKYRATGSDILNGEPIVTLINQGSASASEVVAGALQDHHRAIIMGYKSFGKGSVQSVIQLKNNKAIKLTTARYYTPSGRSIQAKGIIPDIVLDHLLLKKNKVTNFSISEADLSGHIENTTNDKDQKKKSKKAKESLATTDYPLNEALQLLKGLAILKK